MFFIYKDELAKIRERERVLFEVEELIIKFFKFMSHERGDIPPGVAESETSEVKEKREKEEVRKIDLALKAIKPYRQTLVETATKNEYDPDLDIPYPRGGLIISEVRDVDVSEAWAGKGTQVLYLTSEDDFILHTYYSPDNDTPAFKEEKFDLSAAASRFGAARIISSLLRRFQKYVIGVIKRKGEGDIYYIKKFGKERLSPREAKRELEETEKRIERELKAPQSVVKRLEQLSKLSEE